MPLPETIYFPDTAIHSAGQLPVLMLFSRVHVILPVDDGDAGNTLTAGSRCVGHAPHPLGQDRDRFLYLINDIKNRKDDYAAQLSQVTLAAMSAPRKRGDESEHQIVSSLLGRQARPDQDDEKAEKDALWQARLVLKIAEILDREEDEVHRALALLEQSEASLFERLKGEGGDEEEIEVDLEALRSGLARPRSGSMENRLRAWFRFVRGASLPACSIWSTTRTEIAEILGDRHLARHSLPPADLGTILLPARLDRQEATLDDALDRFTERGGPALHHLFQAIEAAARNGGETAGLSWPEEDWQALLAHDFPASNFGRTRVRFSAFRRPLSEYSGAGGKPQDQSATILALFESKS